MYISTAKREGGDIIMFARPGNSRNFTQVDFNVQKSTCLWMQRISACDVSHLAKFVDSRPHPGHAIISSNEDNLDILNRRNWLWSVK